jgi:enoyl-CoA hydratase/carnithine racemase
VTDLLDVEQDGDICLLYLRREEKLNALSAALEGELRHALASREVRASGCVVVTGGERVFSAGADVTEMRGVEPAGIMAAYRDTGAVFEQFARLRQPTIAAISGYCLGGGLELALAADFRIADTTAIFGFPEVPIGIVPSSGGTLRAVRVLGLARAKEMILLRHRVDAGEAYRIGLLTERTDPGAALPRACDLARDLAKLPRLAISVAKQLLDVIDESSREGAILLEQLAYGMLATTPNAREAVRGFTNTRTARPEEAPGRSAETS